jgi:hypothetical protein
VISTVHGRGEGLWGRGERIFFYLKKGKKVERMGKAGKCQVHSL